MDVQVALVTKIIETGDLRTPKSYNLQPEYFTSDAARTLFEYVLAHHKEYRSVPTKDWMRSALPEIPLVYTQMEMEALCGHTTEELSLAAYRQIEAKLPELEMAHGAIEAARLAHQEFFALTTRFGKKPIKVLGDRAEDNFIYLTEEESAGRRIPWVWPTLQEATLGAKGEDVVIFYARRKTGKTWTLLQQAEYSARLGYRVLIVEPDMPEHQLMRRLYAIRAGFPYQDMVNKTLFRKDNPQAAANKIKLAHTIDTFAQSKNTVMRFLDNEHDVITMEIVEGLIEETKPDIILIDQFHYLHMAGEHQKERIRRGQLVNRMRTLADKYDVPIIGVTQSNRDNLIEESDKIEQNADAFIRIELDKKKKLLHYVVEGAREWNIDEWWTRSEYCENMSEVHPHHPLLDNHDTPMPKRRSKPIPLLR